MSEELRGRPENASRRFDDIFQITSFLHHEARTKPREYWAPIMTTSPSRESVRKRRRRWQSQCKDSGGNRICKRTPTICSTCTIKFTNFRHDTGEIGILFLMVRLLIDTYRTTEYRPGRLQGKLTSQEIQIYFTLCLKSGNSTDSERCPNELAKR